MEEEVMTDPKMTMEVPPQVREFAEKSVDQAEKAISSFIESATKSIATIPGPMSEVAKQTLAITEASMKAQFEHARKLMQAKSINEVMLLQSEFMRDQFGAATGQLKKMTSDMLSVGKDSGNKITT
jgi:phasin